MRDTPAKAVKVPDRPHSAEARIMGEMNAKLEPKKMGTMPLVTK